MMVLRGRSIRRKLTLIMAVLCVTSVLVTGTVLVGFHMISFHNRMVRSLTSDAELVTEHIRTSLVADDPSAASEELISLAAKPSILGAFVYRSDGSLLTRFGASGHDVAQDPPDFQPDGFSFGPSVIYVFQPVSHDLRTVGALCLVIDTDPLYAVMKRGLAWLLAVVVLTSAAAFLVANRLQGMISRPILELARTARTVTDTRDYSVRSEVRSQDELGKLGMAFNDMLAKIQAQDAELREYAETLEDRVAERTSNLEAVNRELETFSYSVSHDLRAPLRSIIGFSEALVEDQTGALDAEGLDHLRRVQDAARRMDHLIDDLLRLSRLTQQAMQRSTVDLSRLARVVVDELRATDDRRAEVTVADGLTADADPSLLRVVLENLLGNAWKFTSRVDGAIIEFGTSEADGRTAFFVRDNGAGFDMDQADKLFGAFQRLHRPEEFEGTGVGLATVQRIIHRHGGRIWARGEVGKGATFFFTLG